MKRGKIYAVETKTQLYIGIYMGSCYTDNDNHYLFNVVIQKNKTTNPIWSYFMCRSRKIKDYEFFLRLVWCMIWKKLKKTEKRQDKIWNNEH